MKVFRLSRKKYAKSLNGKGAALFGNRWNSKGVEMIYTADSRALAMAEVAVHISIARLPKDYMMLEIEIPKSVSVCDLKKKPKKGWNENPPSSISQELGDDFIRDGTCCVIKVPSAVVKGDFNYLINPYHLDFKKIKIVSTASFPFDTRMFK
jgi:RES domain-containing protein